MISKRYIVGALVLVAGALLLWGYQPQPHNVSSRRLGAMADRAVVVPPPVSEPQPAVALTTAVAGWQSLDHDACAATSLTVQGTMPSWLQGRLLRVGPGKFEMGASKCDYAFDGFATLYSFEIKNNTITFAHTFLQTDYYKKAVATGTIPARTPPKTSLLGKLSALAAKPDPYDNNSISIVRVGDQCMAMTLTPHMTAFDPATLRTLGRVQYTDKIDGHVTTPYPWYDAPTKRWYNVLTQYGNTSAYCLYTTDAQFKRTIVTTISTKSPAYIHSIAMSKRYCIIPLIPFTVNPTDLLFSGKPFVENFVWQQGEPTSFMVIDKQTGKQVKTFAIDPCFVFNQLNAYESGNTLVLDMLACPKTEIIDHMKLANLRNPAYKAPQFTLVRYTLNLANGSSERKELTPLSIQLPMINPAYAQKEYTYVYAVAVDRTKIYKINVKNGKASEWALPGCYCGQPLFVSRPGATAEDDGVLLMVMLDTMRNKSCLVILDAQTLQEKARAYLPHVLPFDMGGLYIPKN